MDEKSLFLGFDHMGINCNTGTDAADNAALVHTLFGFDVIDGKDSIYAGPAIELMKDGDAGRGKFGHIAVATRDIHEAQKHLEEKGFEFDPTSVKYDSKGQLIVVYLKSEISGFAIHLLKK